MNYFVKVTATSTDKSDPWTWTYYVGKRQERKLSTKDLDGWKKRIFAEKFINEPHFWDAYESSEHTYEIVEIPA